MIVPIIILGHKGMLGQMANKYFSFKGYQIITFPNKYLPENRLDYLNQIKKYENAIIINCIGRIKQKTNDTQDLLWANSILPLDLSKSLLPSQMLIHPSTDCVFDGKKGFPYSINDLQDATDDYGWSKQLGELAVVNRSNTHIIRVSIIGTDYSNNAHGLLGWFLSQTKGASLKGFTNHLWNGITTLEWCKYAEMLFDLPAEGKAILHQPGTKESSSKYDMLQLFNQLFEKDFSISPFEAAESVDRRLEPLAICKNLREQLIEMKQFDKEFQK